ncbi:hypothetical protein [Nesterenkonia sphaerica]|uniref:hypothetical protein n=1 Tax=Nesterenkonia sphaerica TaxID=1804988 RepID=UPI00140CFE12|nr:hypothetical protein [Nesterenkonia sphaerica]
MVIERRFSLGLIALPTLGLVRLDKLVRGFIVVIFGDTTAGREEQAGGAEACKRSFHL